MLDLEGPVLADERPPFTGCGSPLASHVALNVALNRFTNPLERLKVSRVQKGEERRSFTRVRNDLREVECHSLEPQVRRYLF